jgi:hypothetical protein
MLASVNATLQASIAQHHGHNYGLAMALVAGTVAIVGRNQFVEPGRDHPPGALHHKLHQKRPGPQRQRIIGGVFFGSLSEKIGRRKAIMSAALLALPVIPLCGQHCPGVGRNQFVEPGRDHPPGALHHKLHQKRPGSSARCRRRLAGAKRL